MAKPPQPGQFLIDGIGPLDAGMNSGLAPTLVPANQASMATNMTFRGGYGKGRPNVREITLDFKGDATLEELATKRTFQGACFYHPDTGPQSLVAAIGGHLFQFFPSGTTCTVADVSVPNDFNSPTSLQAWLWQSERFVIWNDGVNLPIFFDGTFSRRSNGKGKVLATIDGSFVAPAVGANVTVTLTAEYTGPINIPVLVNGNQYTLLSVGSGGGAGAALASALYDPNTSHNIGDLVVSYPSRIGTLLEATPASSFTAVTATVLMNVVGLVTGQLIQIANVNFHVQAIGAVTNFGPWSATPITIKSVATFNVPSIPANSIIIDPSSSPPTPTVGTLTAPFTAIPNTGVSISMSPLYTGPDSQRIWINNGHYRLIPTTSPTTSNVILQNVSATPGAAVSGDITGLPELPAGRMGTYGLGRNWMALTDGFSFIASDIDGGTSGTPVYDFRDAALRVTENTYLSGGGAFRVPGAVGDIRAMRFAATLDVSLGQGPLQVFTTLSAFSCNAPVDRTLWSAITNPILTQSLIGAGAVSQEGTVLANGDIVFRAIDGIRSLILARRDFDTWGNVPQSREVETILDQDDTTLLQFESLVEFDNRLLLAISPTQSSLGVFHKGIIALNEDPISTLRGKAPSIYDGLWTGLNIFQIVTGVFNSVERCYAFCYDSVLSRMRLFEIEQTNAALFDNDTTPVTYSFESAALFNNPKIKNQFDLIELMDGEIYISDLRGVANFEVWYRNNYSDCWTKWINFGVCASNIDTAKPSQYRAPLGLGSPSVEDCDPNTKQPTRIGLTFQVRIQVTGSVHFRGAKFKAVPVPETRYTAPVCKPLCEIVSDASQPCETCVEIENCLRFPTVLYNLNANKTYQNIAQSVQVICPDDTIKPVLVPAGVITYTLPFAPGFTGDYPPLILNCPGGVVVVKTIPSGATQDEIDTVANEMISEGVQAYAQTLAKCAT